MEFTEPAEVYSQMYKLTGKNFGTAFRATCTAVGSFITGGGTLVIFPGDDEFPESFPRFSVFPRLARSTGEIESVPPSNGTLYSVARFYQLFHASLWNFIPP